LASQTLALRAIPCRADFKAQHTHNTLHDTPCRCTCNFSHAAWKHDCTYQSKSLARCRSTQPVATRQMGPARQCLSRLQQTPLARCKLQPQGFLQTMHSALGRGLARAYTLGRPARGPAQNAARRSAGQQRVQLVRLLLHTHAQARARPRRRHAQISGAGARQAATCELPDGHAVLSIGLS